MTETVFVDSFAWIAAINKSDDYHEFSLKTIETFLNNGIKLITSNYVIVETINALSKAEFRKAVVEFVDKLEKSPSVEIIKITNEMYNNSWTLYQQRMDKDWGITHFEQAGYFLVVK